MLRLLLLISVSLTWSFLAELSENLEPDLIVANSQCAIDLHHTVSQAANQTGEPDRVSQPW